MKLIDTHLHLIDRARASHAWTANVLPLHGRDFALDEARALAGPEVVGRIFMEVDVDEPRIADEARWVGELVARGDLLGQIAACRPEHAGGLDGWLEECRSLGVVGLRRILHVVDDDMSRSDLFRANVRKIGQAGFVFDMNFLGRTLDIAYELAVASDGMNLVLDHCGTPDIAGGQWDPWANGITRLASLPHVTLKLSGLTAYCAPGADHMAATAPYIDHVLTAFGPARMVWGSDWPVCNLGAGLPGWMEITRATFGRLSADEQADIGWRNACRVYGVAPPV
jgi:predicted TIM-barrel fold metal-dependent hydrolase